MIHEAFALLTLPFWIITDICLIVLAVMVEWDVGFGAGGIVVIYFFGLLFFSNFHPIDWLAHHWIDLIEYVVIYMAIGAVYGVVKWYFYVTRKADDYAENEGDFRLQYSGGRQKAYSTYKEFLESRDIPPSPKRHKHEILMWMGYWPVSAVVTLIDEPLRRFFTWVYGRLTTLYLRIADYAFSGFDLDTPPAATPKKESGVDGSWKEGGGPLRLEI
jgi:hypothetical protein